MTRFVHDQLAKGILEETLSLGGQVAVDYQLSAERQWIDILFTPAIDPLPQRLGLLGQLPPQVMTLFEPFRNVVSLSQVISCQLKLAIMIARKDSKLNVAGPLKISSVSALTPLILNLRPLLNR